MRQTNYLRLKAIEEIFDMPSVSKHVQSQQAMRTIPMATVRGFYVHLASLSFAETAKYGETGRWPSTHQFKLHLPSFLDRGFESHREALEVKFEVPVEPDQTMYTIQPFSIGYVDGQNKAIIMLSTLALLIDLVPFSKHPKRPFILSKCFARRKITRKMFKPKNQIMPKPRL